MLCTEQKHYYESGEFNELCRKNFEKHYVPWDHDIDPSEETLEETLAGLTELNNLANLKKEIMGELTTIKNALIDKMYDVANQVFDERLKAASVEAEEKEVKTVADGLAETKCSSNQSVEAEEKEVNTVADGLAETKCSSNQMEEAFKKASSKRATRAKK